MSRNAGLAAVSGLHPVAVTTTVSLSATPQTPTLRAAIGSVFGTLTKVAQPSVDGSLLVRPARRRRIKPIALWTAWPAAPN